ncbi:SH2 domain-containing adapter protein E-like [Watersipora subatra]|uniref:SH2 domain-containing adapter protein E-like n=1 Tax=Watersipora subatra TaxID=2589382 RepID=UPI00355AF562
MVLEHVSTLDSRTIYEGGVIHASDTQFKKKLGSSRRAVWLARRRSRSLDSSDFLCDYTALQRSNQLSTKKSLKKEEQRSVSTDSIYEDAAEVGLIKGLSLNDDEIDGESQQRDLSLRRKCQSLSDIDYENVRLQGLTQTNQIKYENVDLKEDVTSRRYCQDSVYDEPWQTVDALQLLLKEKHLDLPLQDVRNEKEVTPTIANNMVNVKLPLLQQSWYHDEISRSDAEQILKMNPVGAFLVRVNSLQRKDLTLSVRTSHEVVHLIAVRQKDCKYILGQFSEPFESAAAMIKYYTEQPLKINGAEKILLTYPVHCDISLAP